MIDRFKPRSRFESSTGCRLMDAASGIVPDQTLEPAMVIALPGIYLGLESQQAELLCVEPNNVIARTSTPSNSETRNLKL